MQNSTLSHRVKNKRDTEQSILDNEIKTLRDLFPLLEGTNAKIITWDLVKDHCCDLSELCWWTSKFQVKWSLTIDTYVICLVFAALLDMFQWNYCSAVPPRWGHVRRIWPVGHQSAHRDHLLLCGDHHPDTDYTGLQVQTHTNNSVVWTSWLELLVLCSGHSFSSSPLPFFASFSFHTLALVSKYHLKIRAIFDSSCHSVWMTQTCIHFLTLWLLKEIFIPMFYIIHVIAVLAFIIVWIETKGEDICLTVNPE